MESTYKWAIRIAKEKREMELNKPQVPLVDTTKKWDKSNSFKWGMYESNYYSKTRQAYQWAIYNNKTRTDCLKRFNIKPDALRAFIYRNNLPKLKTI